ncbi:MAG: sugar isomerase domain-containing protein [Propionicimonas sp.]
MKYLYPELAHAVIDSIAIDQSDAIDAAVELIAGRLLRGGVLHAFGTGHARIPVHEMAGRAGGLVGVNLVRLSDLAFRGGHNPADLADPLLERDPEIAAPLFALVAPRPHDVFLIASNSGINAAVVEFAGLVRAAGLPLVALTSMTHTNAVPPRHASGKRLCDLADIVIDNGAPAGDAALDVGQGVLVGAVSNLAGVVIAQLLTEGVARTFLEHGRTPPVYRSMNLPDGDRHNSALTAALAGRIHEIEA